MSYKELFVQNVDLFTSKQQYLISTRILKWNKSQPQMCGSGIDIWEYENQRFQQIKWLFWSFCKWLNGWDNPFLSQNLEIAEF